MLLKDSTIKAALTKTGVLNDNSQEEPQENDNKTESKNFLTSNLKQDRKYCTSVCDKGQTGTEQQRPRVLKH